MSFSIYREHFKTVLDTINEEEVNVIEKMFSKARSEGRFVFVIGNGGSAANASHFCEDMAKGTIKDYEGQKRLKMLSLTDNTPQIMAWSNDEGFENVFTEQLKTYASEGDILVAISGSGNSQNILTAVEWAIKKGLLTVGVTGFDGGKLKEISRYNLHIPVDNMGVAEAAHDLVFHYFVETLCNRFAKEDGIL